MSFCQGMLKLKRYHEWLAVMRLHGGEATLPEKLRLLWSMVRTVALSVSPFHRSPLTWRQKIRRCQRCPVYDPVMKQCYAIDHETGQTWGCRCYMPVKAALARHGWAREVGWDGVECW